MLIPYKTMEEITGLELKERLTTLYFDMEGAYSGSMPICKSNLPDGTNVLIKITITCNTEDFGPGL